jgi:hypothetical protein
MPGTIVLKQTGTQATLARSFGNQEATCKRISRLLHNERLIDIPYNLFYH